MKNESFEHEVELEEVKLKEDNKDIKDDLNVNLSPDNYSFKANIKI